MTPEQATLVQSTFSSLAPRGAEVASLFYQRLFALDPELRELFQGDMTVQGKKLMQMLGLVVQAICRFYEVVPAVQELGRRHVEYGVKADDYQTVGAALLETLELGLGSAFTPAVRKAWTAAYEAIAETMMSGAEGSAGPVRFRPKGVQTP
jgi:hemoglobin-like flavoprotein